jgi:hypothetical protein
LCGFRKLAMPTLDVLENGMVVVHSTSSLASMKCFPFLHNFNFKNKWKKKTLKNNDNGEKQ